MDADPTAPAAERAERIRIAGTVQGVGFRYHACDVARRAGVSGWVRNRLDGSVEAFAQGPAAAIDRFVEGLRAGPPLARVTAVEREPAGVERALEGFRIRR